MGGQILIVDDEASICESLAEGLRPLSIGATWKTSAAGGMAALQAEDFDAVILDIKLREANGLDLCAQISDVQPELPIIIISAYASVENAIGAMRAGAFDFLTKPFELEELAVSLERAFYLRDLKREVHRLRERPEDRSKTKSIQMVGNSHSMRKVFDMVQRVAPSDATVLIIGESGTGKELIARALHDHSPRGDGAFIAVNCAAMPATLLESELFGHTKGAFTDARQARKGLFVEASGGTLLLDEIAEMPAEMQAKLLRALQERSVRPIGGSAEIPFDVRILAATNRDLEAEVKNGNFREDLFYRINVVRIESPPLRSRGNDILLLAQAFLDRAASRNEKQVSGISVPAAQKLLSYIWPGNVRELQNCMEQAVALTRFQEIAVEDLPEKIVYFRSENFSLPAERPTDLLSMEEVELRYILKVLKATGGNKTAAARVLGFDRRTLYRKLEKLERSPPDEKRAG